MTAHRARPRLRREVHARVRVPDRLRRRPLGGAPPDRRASSSATRSSSACSRPTSARRRCSRCSTTAPAWGSYLAQPAPQRQLSTRSTAARPGWSTTICATDEADFDAVDRDWAIRAILGVGADFAYEVLSKEDWFGRRLVADRFRDRRVFICGDAAHLWVPYAGYGMNAGHRRRGEPRLAAGRASQGLGADGASSTRYERERLPITEQVSHFAMNHAHAMAKQRRACRPRSKTTRPKARPRAPRVGQRRLRPQRPAVLLPPG